MRGVITDWRIRYIQDTEGTKEETEDGKGCLSRKL